MREGQYPNRTWIIQQLQRSVWLMLDCTRWNELDMHPQIIMLCAWRNICRLREQTLMLNIRTIFWCNHCKVFLCVGKSGSNYWHNWLNKVSIGDKLVKKNSVILYSVIFVPFCCETSISIYSKIKKNVHWNLMGA